MSSKPRQIHTAACLIIGDEVLNGKTVDTNSPYLARFLFARGINLKKIETIPDDRQTIIDSARALSAAHDIVITSGGIGPTHDDITYPSLAEAFNVPLELHQETKRRMAEKSKERGEDFDWETPSATLKARLRMSELPTGEGCNVLYVDDSVWVPVAVVGGNVHVLPGVPKIFQQLVEGLGKKWDQEGRLTGNQGVRVIISTPKKESEVAEFLTELQKRVESRGVKVGSYPRWGEKRNTVTLVGEDKEYIESLVEEVKKGVDGRRVQVEGEDDGLEDGKKGRELQEEAVKN
ncbi:Molybdopterin binding protein [Ascodesmis nigricans]|uniref:Molybdopterin binding protein n=1 Tax=Ascodesmis nigricans TaxID=341454 RepID=A0A4V3SJB9_9PEZI|nr:Molybdopterin binding protein [Ascodesmis nigricans]